MFSPVQNVQWMQPQMDIQYEAAPVMTLQPVVGEQYVPEPPRVPQRRREIIRVQGPGGQTKQIVKRLPVPQADIIERVTVVQPQQDIINVIIERPPTPPPQIIEKRIVERALPPIVNHRLVRLPAPQAPQPIQAPVQYVQVQQAQQQWSPCSANANLNGLY